MRVSIAVHFLYLPGGVRAASRFLYGPASNDGPLAARELLSVLTVGNHNQSGFSRELKGPYESLLQTSTAACLHFYLDSSVYLTAIRAGIMNGMSGQIVVRKLV